MMYYNPLDGYEGGGWVQSLVNKVRPAYGEARREHIDNAVEPTSAPAQQPVADTDYKQSDTYKNTMRAIYGPQAGYEGGGWVQALADRIRPAYGEARRERIDNAVEPTSSPVQQPVADTDYKQSDTYKNTMRAIYGPQAGYKEGGPINPFMDPLEESKPMRPGVWDARNGGSVPVGPKGTDTVPALTSKGVVALDSQPRKKEYVLTPEMVKELGGEKKLEAMRKKLNKKSGKS